MTFDKDRESELYAFLMRTGSDDELEARIFRPWFIVYSLLSAETAAFDFLEEDLDPDDTEHLTQLRDAAIAEWSKRRERGHAKNHARSPKEHEFREKFGFAAHVVRELWPVMPFLVEAMREPDTRRRSLMCLQLFRRLAAAVPPSRLGLHPAFNGNLEAVLAKYVNGRAKALNLGSAQTEDLQREASDAWFERGSQRLKSMAPRWEPNKPHAYVKKTLYYIVRDVLRSWRAQRSADAASDDHSPNTAAYTRRKHHDPTGATKTIEELAQEWARPASTIRKAVRLVETQQGIAAPRLPGSSSYALDSRWQKWARAALPEPRDGKIAFAQLAKKYGQPLEVIRKATKGLVVGSRRDKRDWDAERLPKELLDEFEMELTRTTGRRRAPK